MSASDQQQPTFFSELDAKVPILMLPVRIETRYFRVNSDLVELRVRVFPSAVHVTADRPNPNAAEASETQEYWRIRKTTGDASAETDAAWQRLIQLFGEPRAQYLRRIFDSPTPPPVVESPSLKAEATALPSRFFVALYQDTTRHFLQAGKLIPPSVAVGPQADPAAGKWQTDFNAAEAIGLGIRLQMPIPIANLMTRLFVFGVRELTSSASGQAAIEDLLQRHLRNDGIALLNAGTPTNNTSDGRVPTAPVITGAPPPFGSDSARLAQALGTDSAQFSFAAGGADNTELLVRAMHTALWPATLGYWLNEVMAPLVPDIMLTRTLSTFRSYVRPRGPFCSIAFNGQPYGVLPATSLNNWRTAANTADPFANFFNSNRASWLAAAAKAPRLNQSADLGTDLMKVLSQSPISTRWIARPLTSQIFYQTSNPTLDAGRLQVAVNQSRDARVQTELAPLGITAAPRALDFVFNSAKFDINIPLVAPGTAPRTAPLAANYISAIGTATIDALKGDTVTGATPRSLLYLMLRHSSLLLMQDAADKLQVNGVAKTRESEFIENSTSNVWARFNTVLPALGNKSIAQVLTGTVPPNVAFTELKLFRQSLQALANQPVAQLERLTAEMLDTASHRLDSWITALATERLDAMRRATPQGCHLGAYAWVEAPKVPIVIPQDGGPNSIDPDSEGFIHAPSMAHARTAAMLRAGFIGRQRQAAQAPFVVDLSSDRVRDARGLLDGVQHGANLAALLGERIERWMIEAGIGPQLPALRAQFSLIDGSGRKRIDGLKAAQAWAQAAPPALGNVPNRLLDAVDAISDLLFAEAVHQQASGNPSRAQPALTALDSGVTMPSHFDVLRTESNSTAQLWRIVLPVAPDKIDAWITSLIGTPAELTATVAPNRTLSVADLGVTARGLLDYAQVGAEAPGLAALFTQKAGGGVATYSPKLTAALRLAASLANVIRGARPLNANDIEPGRTPIAAYDRGSARKEWLHDFGSVRPIVGALDAMDSLQRAAGQEFRLRFYSAAPGQNIVSIGELPAAPVTGLLLDGWTDITPGTDTTTGIAAHYDAPRSRAPQSLLLLVPSNPTAGWSIDDVQQILFETADLAQIRMVRPADVHGSFLPGLYFADNLGGDTIAIDFVKLGSLKNFKDA